MPNVLKYSVGMQETQFIQTLGMCYNRSPLRPCHSEILRCVENLNSHELGQRKENISAKFYSPHINI